MRDGILVAWAVLLGAVGLCGLLTNVYSLVVYGDIVTGVETGDPEYYLPVAGFVFAVQGILTAYYFWAGARQRRRA